MKRLAIYFCILGGPCWSQIKPARVEVATSTPIAIKLESSPVPAWQSLLQFAAAPVIVAFSTLLGVWLANRNNRRTNRQQYQNEMLKWQADKQLEVLSRAGLLVVQARRAVRTQEEEHERGVSLRVVAASQMEIAAADDAARRANQELTNRREELADVAGTAGFALSDTLLSELQSLVAAFAHVCEEVRGGDRRAAQLNELDAKVNDFFVRARCEFESLSGRSFTAMPSRT
jgi:hypothetical protein